MVAEGNVLTLAFLEREPRSAARVLEEIEPGNAAAFLQNTPSRLAAPAVATMVPWSVAQCMEHMRPEPASAILRALSYPDAVSILRLIAPDVRDKILKMCPRRLAREFRNLLTYPENTVGAWMDVGVPAFQQSTKVRVVARTLRRMRIRDASHIFVSDESKRYRGVIPMADLLYRDENAPLADILDSSIRPLSNTATLRSVYSRMEWDRLSTLPVVGRKQNVLGGLSRRGLRRGLSERELIPGFTMSGSMLAQIMSAFFAVATAFVSLTLAAERSPPGTTQEKRRGWKRARRNQ